MQIVSADGRALAYRTQCSAVTATVVNEYCTCVGINKGKYAFKSFFFEITHMSKNKKFKLREFGLNSLKPC